MTLTTTLLLALMAGLSIPAGAAVANSDRLARFCKKRELDSFVAYFGGGALMAAIALVLVPDGMTAAPMTVAAISFLAGGLLFWQIQYRLRRSGSNAANLMGMLLDFMPEAIVLGAAAAQGSNAALLLALLIALQNMPEGFASFYEISASGTRKPWRLFLLAPLAGPAAAWLGYSCVEMGSVFMASLMLFCSGGILYLIFQSIAPEAHLRHRDFPAVGAVTGFLLGMMGTMFIH